MASARRLCDLVNATFVTLSAKDPKTGEALSVELPIVRGTAGAPCVDISKLHASTGMFTIDPGFVGTSRAGAASIGRGGGAQRRRGSRVRGDTAASAKRPASPRSVTRASVVATRESAVRNVASIGSPRARGP